LRGRLNPAEREAAERVILAHVRPLPASAREANALGYHALFILRPDMADYATRAMRYGAKIQPSG
jgi:hypothetical protein